MKIPFKCGDTFLVQGTVTVDGLPQDITGWVIRSQVRQRGTLVSELAVEIINASLGMYRLRDSSTLTWPPKNLVCDIEYILANGQVASTETFEIEVRNGVTQPITP